MKVFFSRINNLSRIVTNRLFPTACLLCNSRLYGGLLCSACEFDLPYLEKEGEHCQQCALGLKGDSHFCGHCLATPPAFCRSIIPFSYRFPVDGLIQRFKYQNNLTVGKVLSELLLTHIQYSYQNPALTWPDLAIPVPLHWRKRWRRGFNQAEMIGQDLAAQLDLPLHTYICKRVRPTPSQKGLSRAERQQNLRRTFALTASGKKLIHNKCIALLDDVVTTTATARELSKLLIKNGAKEVHIWALARTPEHERS